MTYNSWHIDHMDNGGEYTATFGADDFEAWFLAGAKRNTRFTPANQQELYENCLYLAQAESRRITQTSSELKSAISEWADDWNRDIEEVN